MKYILVSLNDVKKELLFSVSVENCLIPNKNSKKSNLKKCKKTLFLKWYLYIIIILKATFKIKKLSSIIQ